MPGGSQMPLGRGGRYEWCVMGHERPGKCHAARVYGAHPQLETLDSQRSGSSPQEPLEDMSGDRRVLLQPAQRVRVPGAAVRDVDAQAVIRLDEPALQVLADAEEHLKLVVVTREAPLHGRPHRPRGEPFVLRSETHATSR